MEINKPLVKEYTEKTERVIKDFFLFCTEVLGYREDKTVGYFDLNDVHKELCTELQRDDNQSKLILMPRHSIKSNICTVGYSLWRLVKNCNIRILIYSDSVQKAQGFLHGIKTHLEGKAPNSQFREMFGAWETDPHRGGTYNESRVTVNVREHDQKEPSVDTGGIESSKIGMHYDIIIFDDIVSDLNTTTKMQMDKIHDCYKKSLSLLKPGGEVILVGTRWNHGDAYGRIISENKEKKNFKVILKDAEERREDGKMIFEDVGLTREFLNKQKIEQGSFIYSSLYRNNPVSDETAMFKIENFQYYEPYEEFHKNLFISCTCDPAGEGEDFTAVTVVGTDKDMNIYVLDAVNDHLKPNQIIDTIIRLNYKWGFDRFAIEKNFFQGMLQKELRNAVNEEMKNKKFKSFGVQEIMATMKNRTFNRVLSLQPYHERQQVYLPGKEFNYLSSVMSELAYQMIQFTIDGSKSPHDDLLISLSYHIEIISRGGEPAEQGPPKNSPAWLEKKWIAQENQMQRRLPRRCRRYRVAQLS